MTILSFLAMLALVGLAGSHTALAAKPPPKPTRTPTPTPTPIPTATPTPTPGPAFGADISDPAPVNTDAGSDTRSDAYPSIATDGQGNWAAVWERTGWVNPNGTGSDSDIIVARSSDNGTTWTESTFLLLQRHRGGHFSGG